MRIKQIVRKTMAVTAAAGLAVTGCTGLTACTDGEGAPDSIAVEEDESKEEKAMGRYLEEDISLPEGCTDISGMEFLKDGTLRLCYSGPDYVLMYADSTDKGQTWGAGVSLYELMNLDAEEYSLCFPKLAKDGGILSGAYLLSEEEDESGMPEMCYFYVSPEGTVRELDISEALGNGGFSYNSEFTEKGTVLMEVTGNGLVEIDPLDGSIKNKYEAGESLAYFGVIGNHIITVSPDDIHYYDADTGKPAEDAEALTEQISSNSGNMQITGVGTYPVLFAAGDEEDSLFFVDSNGMYRYSFAGSIVEKIVDGSLNTISSPDTQFVDLVQDEEGCFYLAVLDSGSGDTARGRILKYTYSKDTPAVPDTELSVYALTDNSFIRQIAAVFQKKYPDIYLNLETGISGEDAVTSTDALKTLNTEIMAGKGPDILILDGIPEDTYIEKGMLEDLSSILDKIEETDGILQNVKDAYTQEDGSIYCMPVKFGIPMIQGDQKDVDAITDLETLADVIVQHKEEYHERMVPLFETEMPEVLLDSLAEVCAPAWIKADGTLDETAVTEYLEQTERIYQAGKEAEKERNNGEELEYHYFYEGMQYNVSTSATVLLGGFTLLSTGGLYSPNDLAWVDSVEKEDTDLTSRLWNGQAENCFLPRQTVGISTKAAEKEAAEKFVEFLFSQEGQSIGKNEGFPVNQTVYESSEYWDLREDEDGVVSQMSSSNPDTGEMFELLIREPGEETIQKIRELGKGLTVPSAANAIILKAVTDSGSRYLREEISLEEAVNEIIQEVNLYLSE